MPGNHRGRSGQQGGSGAQPRGLFEKGNWLCDCSPRQPANKFQSKNGRPENNGRWFYTCQKSKGEAGRCDFFLWQDDANVREEAAIMNNSTSEPVSRPRPPQQQQQQRQNQRAAERTPPPPYSLTAPPSSKRKLPWQDGHEEVSPSRPSAAAGPARRPATTAAASRVTTTDPRLKDGDDGDEADISTDEERELCRAADAALHTPRKAARTDLYDTPRTATRTADLYETPSKPPAGTSVRHGLATPETAPRRKGPVAGAAFGGADDSPFVTPGAAVAKPASLLADTLDVLQRCGARPGTEAVDALHAVYERHDARMQGILRGREIARVGIQDRDATIVELKQRVGMLEGQLESSKALVKHLREEVARKA